MKRYETQSIGEVLRQLLSEANMEGGLNEAKAVSAWAEVLGPHLAPLCGRPIVCRGVMTVCIRNASLRQELSMTRESLIRAINRAVGTETISDLRLIY